MCQKTYCVKGEFFLTPWKLKKKKKKKSANIAHAEQTDQLLSKNIWDDVESVSKHAVLIKLKTIA